MRSLLLTFHDANNYGAVLQAVATYKVLSRYSDCDVADYYNPTISGQMKILRYELGLKSVIHDLLRIPYRLKVLKKFKKFLKDNCQLSGQVDKLSELAFISKEYDVVFAGSDQIWNPECQTESDVLDAAYFLDFDTTAKKISYASSLGGYSYSEEQLQVVIKALKQFDQVSVRESDSAFYLENAVGCPVEHVLDPTLLLSKAEWVSMESSVDIASDEYILVYQLNKNKLNTKTIDHVKKITGIQKVVVIDQGFFSRHELATQLRSVGPSEFIYLFNNASYVVTDSFHGCCFSINFQKKFVCIAPPKRSNRLESLVAVMGIENYLVRGDGDIDLISFEYNFEALEKVLIAEREKSIRFIQTCFDGVRG